MSEITHSALETQKQASKAAKKIKAPCVILLEGPLGAGKTEWVRGFTRAYLGKKQAQVSSPTYSVVNIYGAAKKVICHVDLYRLKDADDLESVGFWDLLERKNVVLVEWGERLKVQWPKGFLVHRYVFEIIDERTRRITLEIL